MPATRSSHAPAAARRESNPPDSSRLRRSQTRRPLGSRRRRPVTTTGSSHVGRRAVGTSGRAKAVRRRVDRRRTDAAHRPRRRDLRVDRAVVLRLGALRHLALVGESPPREMARPTGRRRPSRHPLRSGNQVDARSASAATRAPVHPAGERRSRLLIRRRDTMQAPAPRPRSICGRIRRPTEIRAHVPRSFRRHRRTAAGSPHSLLAPQPAGGLDAGAAIAIGAEPSCLAATGSNDRR